MKLLQTIILILFSQALFGQQKDTVFLVKEIIDTPYFKRHYIYIDSGLSCIENHKHIYSFDWLKKNYKKNYESRLRDIKNFKNYSKDLVNFPRQWITLHLYKNELYTYACNASGHNEQFELTDSTFIWYSMEGPEISKLYNLELSPNKISFNALGKYTKGKIVIEYINKQKGIAILNQYSSSENNTLYRYLLVDVKKANLFRIIVDYCLEEEECDFIFDENDFTKLKKIYKEN